MKSIPCSIIYPNQRRIKMKKLFLLTILLATILFFTNTEELIAKHTYDDYEDPYVCMGCHFDIFKQWNASSMAKGMTNKFMQAQYFKLALPDGKADKKVEGVIGGCIGCHAPASFVVGDIPPETAEKNTPANRGVFCDFCHTITGMKGEMPFNFNYTIDPGKIKRGPFKDSISPHHDTAYSEFHTKAEFCGMCHDEVNPFNVKVKATYTEWKKGPYAKKGIQCQDCHMTPAGRLGDDGKPHYASGIVATGGPRREKYFTHRFPGAHTPGQVEGAIKLNVSADKETVAPGDTVTITVKLTNVKVGHMFPSGSSEERQLWLHLTATDQNRINHIPWKSSKPNEPDAVYGITSNKPAYQGLEKNIKPGKKFDGFSRDALPEGDRLYHLFFEDPDGYLTLSQYYAAKIVYDNRLKPEETRVETYQWKIPSDIAKGEIFIDAKLNYRYMPQSFADYLEIGEIPIIEVAKKRLVLSVR